MMLRLQAQLTDHSIFATTTIKSKLKTKHIVEGKPKVKPSEVVSPLQRCPLHRTQEWGYSMLQVPHPLNSPAVVL